MALSVEQQLLEANIEYKKNPNKPNELKIRCISGLHPDNNPSLSISLDKEMCYCFSCGYGGSLVKLFKDLKIEYTPDVESKQSYALKKLKTKLKKLTPTPIHLPEPRYNISFDFKDIDQDVLKEFGVFTTDHSGMNEYVWIPVYQQNQLRFIEGRYKLLGKEKGNAKYLRKPEGANVKEVLFPLDKVKNFSTVVLVEGIFDLLNLWQLGYTSTLCIFGVQSFNTNKVKLLDERGVKKVVVLMDGDIAGKRASASICNLLDKHNIDNVSISLREGEDPGSLTQKRADSLLKPYITKEKL